MTRNKNRKIPKESLSLLLLLCISALLLNLLIKTMIITAKTVQSEKKHIKKPTYYILSSEEDSKKRNIELKCLHSVLHKVGYKYVTKETTDWDLLWAQNISEYELQAYIEELEQHQLVNQYPGSDYITNAVHLATSKSKYLPAAFKLPDQIETFKNYTRHSPQTIFLERQKTSNAMNFKDVKDFDLYSGNVYAQEFIQKPFLIDERKFDIGVYVVITSVNPLRAYWYKGDVLIRFCRNPYHPFHKNNTSSYLTNSTYLGVWELPSLSYYYSTLGNSVKNTFDYYLRSQGKEPSHVWAEVEKAIAEILLMKEQFLVAAVRGYPSQHNFFEMMRFDFVLDESLRLYLLKVKKSPEFGPSNNLEEPELYKQLLHNLFWLTGVSRKLVVISNTTKEINKAKTMITSDKHIAVFGKECRSDSCRNSCEKLEVCQLCNLCLNKTLKGHFLKAHTEFLHRGDFKRVFPPPMHRLEDTNLIIHLMKKGKLTAMNRLHYFWFQGKCNRDETWCT